jgi:uncharacterized protein (TIGR02646 family)
MRYFQRLELKTAVQNQLLAKESTNWKSLSSIQRREIVKKLLASQKSLCAYCECRISRKDNEHHIDHFEERHDSPKIWDYNNFLLCCQGNTTVSKKNETLEEGEIRRSNISCGHQKTKSYHGEDEINYDLLLNPTKNVFDLFSYIDGVIEPSRVCTTEEKIQVNYTVKRLNLDAFRIENERKREIRRIRDLLELSKEDEQKTFINSILDETQAELNPYFSTIKDNFGFMLL